MLLGLLQVAAMLLIMLVLERRWPVEPVTDRHAVTVDVIYSLVHRLGLFRLALFFTLEPLWDALLGQARLWGLETWHLDSLWPGVTDVAWVSLLIYLVLFDFVGYWVHRAQHQFQWWWALHAVHHSQRQMTVWSDNRNHLLDDALLGQCVCAAGGADRRRARPVRGHHRHHAAAAEPAARQPALAFRPAWVSACS